LYTIFTVERRFKFNYDDYEREASENKGVSGCQLNGENPDILIENSEWKCSYFST